MPDIFETLPERLAATPDLSHAVRRLRWFTASFADHLAITGDATGLRYRLNNQILARVFLTWLDRFEATRGRGPKRTLIHHAAGLMLRGLIEQNPIMARPVGTAPVGTAPVGTAPVGTAPVGTATVMVTAQADRPARAWPEGYACLAYSLNMCAAVLKQEYGQAPPPDPRLEDPAFWWSFRENTQEDPATAIAFLKLLVGETPNWSFPAALPAAPPWSSTTLA